MVTSDEIAAIPLFASLDGADRARLAQASADIRLADGRVRRARGRGARALRRARGPDRGRQGQSTASRRCSASACRARSSARSRSRSAPTFPSGFRASEPSRVMQVAAREYYTVAAAAPEVAMKVGKLARERIGGLQGVAAEAPQPRALVLGHRWDAACSELRRFLDRNQITFDWITPDATDAAERWGGAVPADGDCPALRARTARRSCDRSCATSPSCSACRRARPPASTTRSSSAPGRPGWPPPSTARRRACARS